MSDREPVFMSCEDPCYGPVVGHSDLTIDLCKLAWWLVVKTPDWFSFGPIGNMLWPHAGTFAYTCSCRDKNRAMREIMFATATLDPPPPAES